MKNKFKALISGLYIFCVVFSLNACSTITSAWYSQPEKKYRVSALTGSKACVTAEGVQHEIWSESSRYGVSIGPAFLPVYPNKPPVADGQIIDLQWSIRLISDDKEGRGEGSDHSVKIRSLALVTDDGVRHFPVTVSVFKIRENGSRHFVDYLSSYGSSKLPEEYKFNEAIDLEICYLNVIYDKNKWHEFTPTIRRGERIIKGPVIRFKPKRDYEFNACISPFYFPSVR